MIKSTKYSLVKRRKFELFSTTLLVLLIAFTSFSNFALTSETEIETETTEIFADGENENKETENLDKPEKDILLGKSCRFSEVSNINRGYNDQDLTKLNNLFLKIPTPPPDFG